MFRFLPEPTFLSEEYVEEPVDGARMSWGGVWPHCRLLHRLPTSFYAGSSAVTSLTSSKILIPSFRASTEGPLSSPSPNSSAVTGLYSDQGGESNPHVQYVHRIAAMKTQWETQSTTLVIKSYLLGCRNRGKLCAAFVGV